jgi:hypothetical protein
MRAMNGIWTKGERADGPLPKVGVPSAFRYTSSPGGMADDIRCTDCGKPIPRWADLVAIKYGLGLRPLCPSCYAHFQRKHQVEILGVGGRATRSLGTASRRVLHSPS